MFQPVVVLCLKCWKEKFSRQVLSAGQVSELLQALKCFVRARRIYATCCW